MHHQFVDVISNYGHGKAPLAGFVHTPDLGSGLLSLLLEIDSLTSTSAKILFGIFGAGVIGLASRSRNESVEVEFALSVVVTVLTSFWVMHYDLAILSIPILLVGAELSRKQFGPRETLILVSMVGLYFSYAFTRPVFGGVQVKPELLWLFVLTLILLQFERKSE